MMTRYKMDSLLEKIYSQNPWINDAEAIHRDIHLEKLQDVKHVWRENEFLQHTFTDGVYMVYGQRQVGKTTHLKLLLQKKITGANHKNFLYFNCDFLDSKQEIVSLVESWLNHVPNKKQRMFIALDEITSVKDSILGIKYLVDNYGLKDLSYILTGSSSVNIKKTGEYLPGRRGKGRDFIFNPLSFSDFVGIQYPGLKKIDISSGEKTIVSRYHEIISEIDLDVLFAKYLHCGGIPFVMNEFLATGTISADTFEIYRSWLSSEIAKHDKKEYIVKTVFNRALQSLSSEVSYNAILQEAGVGSHNTIHDYLAFLHDSFFITQVYHFDISRCTVNYRKNKKLYFNDPFIIWLADYWLNSRVNQDFGMLRHEVVKSQIVENAVANHLTRLTNGDMYYYKNSYEIDFVNRSLLVEVKYRKKVVAQDYRHISKMTGKHKKYVLTKNDIRKDGDVWLLPVAYMLCGQQI